LVLIDCVVLQLSLWTCSFLVLTLSRIIINFHIVCSLRVAKMLWLGISSVLVGNDCIYVFTFAFITFVSLFIAFIVIRLPMYYGRFLSEIKPDWLIGCKNLQVNALRVSTWVTQVNTKLRGKTGKYPITLNSYIVSYRIRYLVFTGYLL